MNNLKLPSLRTVVEDISLKTAKLDKILEESQSRVASYLDIRYPDCQEIIFLLGGKGVKAGRFTKDGNRTALHVNEALQKLKKAREGSIGFFEISKLLMGVILGTFIFKPTHAKLKSEQIDFNSLLELLARKRFIGYLELKTSSGLNYLTFFDGKAREGYFSDDVSDGANKHPAEIIANMIEKFGEQGEINVYESAGEEGLHDNDKSEKNNEAGTNAELKDNDIVLQEADDKDYYTLEMIDLCIVAVYEDLFRIMVNGSAKHLDTEVIDTIFMECLKNATLKHAVLFRGTGTKENGALLPTGLINFERLLKSKEKLPFRTREQDFLEGTMDLAWFRLNVLKQRLPAPLFNSIIKDLNEKIAGFKKTYKGSFTIIKFLFAFLRLIEKIQSGHNE